MLKIQISSKNRPKIIDKNRGFYHGIDKYAVNQIYIPQIREKISRVRKGINVNFFANFHDKKVTQKWGWSVRFVIF